METITEKEKKLIIDVNKENEMNGGSPNLFPYLKKNDMIIFIDKFEKVALYSNSEKLEGIYQKESLDEFKSKIDKLLADGWERHLAGIYKMFG